MSAVIAVECNFLLHEDGRFVEVDGSAKLLLCNKVEAIAGTFFKPNYAAGDVPSRPMKAVAAPCQQRALTIVLNQEVDVDERRNAADEQKEVVGPSTSELTSMGIQLTNQIG